MKTQKALIKELQSQVMEQQSDLENAKSITREKWTGSPKTQSATSRVLSSPMRTRNRALSRDIDVLSVNDETMDVEAEAYDLQHSVMSMVNNPFFIKRRKGDELDNSRQSLVPSSRKDMRFCFRSPFVNTSDEMSPSIQSEIPSGKKESSCDGILNGGRNVYRTGRFGLGVINDDVLEKSDPFGFVPKNAILVLKDNNLAFREGIVVSLLTFVLNSGCSNLHPKDPNTNQLKAGGTSYSVGRKVAGELL